MAEKQGKLYNRIHGLVELKVGSSDQKQVLNGKRLRNFAMDDVRSQNQEFRAVSLKGCGYQL